MSDVHDQRIFAAEQIEVPDSFPGILKNFIKEVVRAQPENSISFARQYFEELHKNRDKNHSTQKVPVTFNPKEFYLKKTGDINECYEFFETIGQGSLSRVRRATNLMNQCNRAIKIVKKCDLEFGERAKLLDEIELLEKLDHPNIGQVLEMYEDQKRLYFVSEIMYGGSLFEKLMRTTHLPEKSAASIIRQLLSATAYLHAQGYVHGDIKPNNILFRSKDDDLVKLIDFGTSRRISGDHHMHGVFGTGYYCAPEVIHGDYSEKCDVFSIGVIFFMILSGQAPFEGPTAKDVLDAILKGSYSMTGPVWSHVSQKAKDLIDQMLCRQDERLTAEEALLHPYFDDMLRDSEEGIVKQQAQTVGQALQNLRTFNANTKVHQSCLGFLVKHFTFNQETIELEKVFRQLDTSGDGFLSRDELLAGYRALYGADFNAKEVDALMEMADSNGDGKLSYNEWLMTAVKQDVFFNERRLDGIFAELDVDASNTISLGELQVILSVNEDKNGETASALKDAFASIDADNKGEITFDQFKALMKKIMSN